MVEEAVRERSGELGKYQLWKQLPKKMMYQVFKVILDYLEHSGKIMITDKGILVWTWDPEGIRRLKKSGVRFL